jgi:ribonuclease E
MENLVTRKMLINAQRTEEVRVAIMTDGTLDKYEISASDARLYRGNIYRGVVVNLQPSLDAAFVDIGTERHGLLRAEDVVAAAAHRTTEGRRPKIDKLLERGRPILVQVTRDGLGTKGPQITSNLSIAGRYLVLMPYDDVRGVSRKVDDDETRSSIRERLQQLNLPDGCGVIVRTNATDQPKTALNRDLSALLRLWTKVRAEAGTGKGPRLLYSDQDLILQVLRDSLDSSIEEVLVDSDVAFEKVKAYMRTFMPRAKTRLVRYAERMPLFSRFQLEEQIDRIYLRKVELPSGASIVIEGTEALTAIDVNSGRATRASSQEETASNTNLETAREVARQLRLRDIGGLVVVDFIDMRSPNHRRDVERALRDAMKDDKARFTVGRISPNGLLEINRQRLKKELKLRTHRSCPTCGGTGTLASHELVGLSLLRRIETRAVTGRLKGVRVELHPELADAIQNERRDEIAAIEREFDIRVEVIAATALHRSEEHIEWSTREEADAPAVPEPAVTVADLADGVDGEADREPSETPDDAATEAEESARPRRRRRGGRRKKKAPAQTGDAAQTEDAARSGDAAQTGDAQPAAGQPAAEASPAAANEPAEKTEPESAIPESNGEEKPKKRRPRRRRRKKPAAEAAKADTAE